MCFLFARLHDRLRKFPSPRCEDDEEKTSNYVALSQMKDHPARLGVHLFHSAHTDEWWMNVNVIKQFSVYLKLQTFTLHTPSRGRFAKNYFSSPFFVSFRWWRAETMPRRLFFFRLLLLQDPVASKSSFYCACLYFSSFFFLVWNLYFGCCLSLTDSRGSSIGNLPPAVGKQPEDGTRENRKKWSHNRRNMNKRYLNTNECLKIP